MTSHANGAKLNFITPHSTHSKPPAIKAMSSPYRPRDLLHSTHLLTTRQGRLSTSSPPSVGNIPLSTSPSVGDVPPSTPPHQTHSSELSTPYSTGYAPTSDSEYSPPMATDLLPDAPQTLDLMILTEYINSMFKQAGNNATTLDYDEMSSMHEFLRHCENRKEDMEAGFLHAVSIVCKAKKALQAAVEEARCSSDAEALIRGQARQLAIYSETIIPVSWEKVDMTTARWQSAGQLRDSITQAYGAVAEIKVAIVDVYRRQMDAQASTEGEAHSLDETGDKDRDKIEVDSIFET